MNEQGDIVAHSVDGDFIPIALIRHESMVLSNNDKEEVPYRIALYRLKYNIAGTKRKMDGQQKRREFEYVCIPDLYSGMQKALAQAASCMQQQQLHYMRLLAVLIGMTGTDFTRNLPHMSPGTVWTMISESHCMHELIRCYDPESSALNTMDACNLLAARYSPLSLVLSSKFYFNFRTRLYMIKFAKHVPPSQRGNLQGLLAALCSQRSRLADKTKKELPTAPRIETTFKNINWLLQYWMCRDPVPITEGKWDYGACFPDPVSEEYGFAASGEGKIVWLDLVPPAE